MWAMTRTRLAGLGNGGEEIIETFHDHAAASAGLDLQAALIEAMPGLRVIERTATEFYVQAPKLGPAPRTCITIEEV